MTRGQGRGSLLSDMDLLLNIPDFKAHGRSPRAPRRHSRSSRRRVGLFGLLAAIGFLAFMFSAVSPYDDDVQQEFVQSNKPKQLLVANHKASRDARTFGVHRVPPAILQQMVLDIDFAAIQHDASAHAAILRTSASNASRDRSPPAKLSYSLLSSQSRHFV